MTDLDKFLELYRSMGIELAVVDHSGPELVGKRIDMEAFKHPKFDGYVGFGSSIYFTSDGQFIRQDFWE